MTIKETPNPCHRAKTGKRIKTTIKTVLQRTRRGLLARLYSFKIWLAQFTSNIELITLSSTWDTRWTFVEIISSTAPAIKIACSGTWQLAKHSLLMSKFFPSALTELISPYSTSLHDCQGLPDSVRVCEMYEVIPFSDRETGIRLHTYMGRSGIRSENI